MKIGFIYLRLAIILMCLSLGLMFQGCGNNNKSEGWDMPAPNKTGISPTIGVYSSNQPVHFEVTQDAQSGQKYVHFSIDGYRYDNLSITDGAFINEWGDIGGTNCPTDAYAISSSFINESKATGTIKYGYDCKITSEASFTAELKQ